MTASFAILTQPATSPPAMRRLACVLFMAMLLGGIWIPQGQAAHAQSQARTHDAALSDINSPQLADSLIGFARSLLDEATTLDTGSAEARRAVPHVMSLQCSELDTAQADLEVLQNRVDEALEDTGLDFQSSLRNDLYDSRERGLHLDRANVRAGLVWDIIADGYLDNNRRARELDANRAVAEMDLGRDQQSGQYACRDMLLLHTFDLKRLEVLRLMRKLGDLWEAELTVRYHRGLIFLDDVIAVREDMLKVDTYIKSVESRIALLADRPCELLQGPVPIPEPDLGVLLHTLEARAEEDRDKLEIAGAAIREKYDDFYDIDLELYANAGVDHEPYSNEQDVRWGMDLRVPIEENKADERLAASEINALRVGYKKRRETDRLDLLRRQAAYKEKLADAVALLQRERLTRERLRRAVLAFDLAPTPTSPVLGEGLGLVAKQSLEHLSVRLETLNVQESLYRQLLHMLPQTGLAFEPAMVRAWEPPPVAERARPLERSAYLWSRRFNGLPNKRILDFCRAKRIGRLMLSAGRGTAPDKLDAFLRLASTGDLRVELMYSDTGWVFPAERREALKRMVAEARLASGVHLDVEPHTLPEYKKNPPFYQALLVNLVESAAERLGPGVSLSVSVSPRYSTETIQRIARHARVHVMAYGITTPQRMEKLLASLHELPADSLVLALRPGDFADEAAMEAFMKEIALRHLLHGFALHTLDTYFGLASGEAAQ